MIKRGISFDKLHSYHDFNMILSAVEIPPALPKTNYCDIPGSDGSIDLTEAISETKFFDRDCKFTLTMNPAGDLSDAAFEEKKTEISNAINGKRCKITLDKDPDFYYLGRCSVSEYLSDKRIRRIVITAKVAPYKHRQRETVRTFDLTPELQTVYLRNSRKTVCPEIECTNDDCFIKCGASTFSVSAGKQKILDIQLKEGITEMQISGTGTMTFRYQEGEL